ncbi:alpha/beta hydrolase [Jeotgalibaca sp. MA1X17-3]|uniref:alpha/beta hydrolase n=1 Tax=Jeotgalibaca sp. MA1X17-3 TaxID=2908211 RepID=UPI001F1C59DF|nr:alpha/beta hydrolase [Jeotgalibaca sp. MA1X17-3]UJF16159.1 alpha/beta hydrolase [Jeotgalibaca sp. MA1X17-3]
MKNEIQQPLVYKYGQIKQEPLHFYLYKATQNRKNKTIFYFHGGGLVYGSAHDLPDLYRQMLLDAGYDFIAFEYPLAPETKMKVILEKIAEGMEWFQKNYHSTLQLSSSEFILFGRSAGAYLSILTARALINKPKALLLLYGYHTLEESSFRLPSRHYLTFPLVSEQVVNQLVKDKPIVEGPIELRFGIYIHYRQSGNWIRGILGAGIKPSLYSLSEEDLSQLPPSFLAASTGDPDVPFRLSEKMEKEILISHLETIHSNEHDFDRVDLKETGPKTYSKIISWLEQTLS